jgi:hypothetical protein
MRKSEIDKAIEKNKDTIRTLTEVNEALKAIQAAKRQMKPAKE